DDCEGHPLLVVKFVYRLDKLSMTAPYEAATRRLCGTKRVSPAAPMISSSAPGRSGVALRSAKLPRRGFTEFLLMPTLAIRHRSARLRHSLRGHRHRPQALAGRLEDRVADRGGDGDDRRFARSFAWKVFAIQQDSLQHRRVAESRHLVLGKRRV